MTQRVLVDANILARRTLLDWLFHFRIQHEDMFQLFGTEDIFVEALRVERRRLPHADGRLLERRSAKNRRVLDEVLETFPAGLRFTGDDADDYHVHAAAIAGGADIILTQNSASDFTRTPDDEPYEVYTADDFFLLIAESDRPDSSAAPEGRRTTGLDVATSSWTMHCMTQAALGSPSRSGAP